MQYYLLCPKMIYRPSEDSFLLQETLKKYLIKFRRVASREPRFPGLKIIDMGSGSGIQALTCKDLKFKNILTLDINQLAVNHLKSLKLKAIKSNLFSKIKKSEKFDLIIFNPPYLPEDRREPKDSKLNTTAGKKGYEIIIKFLEQATNHLNKDGSILLLFSSLSRPRIVLKQAKVLGYNYSLLNKKKLFFEELYVYEFKLKDN